MCVSSRNGGASTEGYGSRFQGPISMRDGRLFFLLRTGCVPFSQDPLILSSKHSAVIVPYICFFLGGSGLWFLVLFCIDLVDFLGSISNSCTSRVLCSWYFSCCISVYLYAVI